MNDNPGGGCGPVIVWLVIIGIAIAGFMAFTGIGEDKYHCYTQPVGPSREVGMVKGLNLEQAQAHWGDCYQTR